MGQNISNIIDSFVDIDVLVIGGGGAACRAAIEAHDQGSSVLMIVKGNFGNSGCTLYVGTSAAVGPWASPEDSNDISLQDLLSYGGYLGNRKLAKILIDETMDRISELDRWGIEFVRDNSGNIIVNQSAEHTFPRNFAFKPNPSSSHEYGSAPGIALMDVLIEQVTSRKINVADQVALIDLICVDGKVLGAICLDIQKNRLVVFRSKATVLATGTYSQIFSPTTVSAGETGDGQAAAFRAGTELIDMECSQFVASTTSHVIGARFLNTKREAFVEKYNTSFLSPMVAKESQVYAIAKEIKNGGGTERGTVYLDLRTPLQNESLAKSFLSHFQQRMRFDPISAMNKGLDPRFDIIETCPAAHTTIGGIRINDECATNITGLYAAGSVAGGIYGLARPEGYTSMITLVFGRRAGLFAAEYSNQSTLQKIDAKLLNPYIEKTTSIIDNENGASVNKIKSEIRNTLTEFGWVIKDEEGLSKGINQIRRIREKYPSFDISNGRDWLNALELGNMLLAAELLLLGSLQRKESRGAFFRDDYPNLDNSNWMHNIIYRQADSKPILTKHDPNIN